MKKIIGGLAVSFAALVAAAPAQAQTADNGGTIVIDGSGVSGTFGDASVTCPAGATAPCSFMNTFTFTTPAGFNLASATISSVATSALTNIDFTSVTLNGVQFTLVEQGVSEFRRILNQNIIPGATNTIMVSGTSGGDASFSGTLSFSAVSAVPEPATWAFMLIGFGAVGYSMRKRPAYKLAAQAV